MSKINANHLFVYGYLMRRNRILEELGVPDMPVEYIGEGFIFGHLYKVAGYPGFVYDSKRNKRVYGEIYLVKEKKNFFKEMDSYELSFPNYKGPDTAYHRRVRPTNLLKGFTIPCWVYEYIQPTEHLEEIKSGRFALLS